MKRSPFSSVTSTGYGRAKSWVIFVAVLATLWLLVAYPQDQHPGQDGVHSPTTRKLFQQSFGLALSTAVASVPLGVILAWFTSRTNLPCRRLLLILLLLGVTLPLYMHAAVWEAGFGQLGWFQLAYRATARPLLSGWRAAWWVHVMAATPWVVLFTLAYLRSTGPNLEELALVDASTPQVFWQVTLIQTLPVAVFAMLWVMVWVAGEMTVTDLFQVRTFAEEVYVGFAVDRAGGPQGVSPTVVSGICFTSVLALLALAACLWVVPRLQGVEQSGREFTFDLGPWRWTMLLLVGLAVTCMIVIPLGNLIYKAGVELQPATSPPKRIWQATKVATTTVHSLWQFRSEIGWSLAICQLASLSATLLSTLMYLGSRRWLLARMATLAVAALGMALPGPLLGVGIVHLFTAVPGALGAYLYSHTIAAPWLAMTIKCFPLCLGLTWITMSLTPENLDDAARSDGATRWQSLLYVLIPARITAVAVVFLSGVVYCLGDLAASILVVPPGVMTVAISIFGMIHSGVEDRLAALCLACTGLLSILGIVIWWGSRLILGGPQPHAQPASPLSP